MAHRSRFIGAGAITFAAGMLIALPTFSNGATVKNDLRSFAPAQTRATSANPRTEPPLHGTNPHAQGTAAVVDLTPSAERPFSLDPTGGGTSAEDIVVGRSRGEQRADGTYHGHVTVAALFGNELIGRDTAPGETVNEAIAEDLLDGICTGLGVCVDLVRVRSATTNLSSLNSFSLATAALTRGGVPALAIGAAQSVGNITSDGTCQESTAVSSVADVAAGTAVAELSESSSASRACRGVAPTQTNTSRVLELGGAAVPLPAAGCATGAADTETGLPPLLPVVCNADDSNGSQAAAPYGVRNALDVYVLAVGGTALSQVSTAQSESLAVAPAAVTTPPTTTTPTTTTPTTTTPAVTTPTPTVTTPTATTPATADGGGDTGDDGGEDDAGNEGSGDDGTGDDDGGGATECSDGVDNDGDGKIDFGSDPGCSSANDDSEADNVSIGGNELPFTGTDVVVLGLAGSILLAAGLTLRGPARRREDF